jgi:hypothetical protein
VRSITLDKKNLLLNSRMSNRHVLHALAHARAHARTVPSNHAGRAHNRWSNHDDEDDEDEFSASTAATTAMAAAQDTSVSVIRKKQHANNTRLMIHLGDASDRPVREGRLHNIDRGADKVHEWDFSCDSHVMEQLETPEWRELQAQQDALRLQQRRMRGSGEEFRAVLEERIRLLQQMHEVAPSPVMRYSPLLSQCEKGKHVVVVEIGRQVAATMWTMVLPIFLVTTISFSQFYVAEKELDGRLSVSLTTILTVVAFQTVVRDRVPAVPYRTLMDNYMLVSLGVMTLQVVGSVVTKSMIGSQAVEERRRLAVAKGGDTGALGASTAAGTWAFSRLGFSPIDDIFLGICLVWWFGMVLMYWWRTHRWRRELAFFSNAVQDALEDCAQEMHKLEARGIGLPPKKKTQGELKRCEMHMCLPPPQQQQPSQQQAVRKRQVAPLEPEGERARQAAGEDYGRPAESE